MRVIAGSLGGRRLASPGPGVRPTSDRAREALFSMLGEIEGLSVLDLYCGTGALGIEAYSRGAARVVGVDIDTRPAAENVRLLDLAGPVDVVASDAVSYLARTPDRFDIVFCDPPYQEGPKVARDLAKAVSPRVEDGGRLVVESAYRTPMPLDLIGFKLERERRYGESLLRIWRND